MEAKNGKRGKLERFLRRARSQDITDTGPESANTVDPQIVKELEKVGIQFPPIQIDKLSKRASHTAKLKSLALDPSLQLNPISGLCEIQGARDYMEDRSIAIDNLRETYPSDKYKKDLPYSYWAVYDGHAGFRAAEMCKDSLHRLITENENFFGGDISKAIQESLEQMDEDIIAKGIEEEWSEGCCVSIVVIVGTVLYAANLGDSHMVLSRNINRYEAIVLSEAHKASVASEKERIVKEGGMVMRNRVFGDLSISRALGDLNYKQPKQQANYVSNQAFSRRVSLTQNNNYIILASDGLWDTVTPQEAVNILYCNASQEPQSLAKILVDEAFERGSKDNITVIVVTLQWESADDTDPLSDPL